MIAIIRHTRLAIRRSASGPTDRISFGSHGGTDWSGACCDNKTMRFDTAHSQHLPTSAPARISSLTRLILNRLCCVTRLVRGGCTVHAQPPRPQRPPRARHALRNCRTPAPVAPSGRGDTGRTCPRPRTTTSTRRMLTPSTGGPRATHLRPMSHVAWSVPNPSPWFLLRQICLLAEERVNSEGRLGWGEGNPGE